MEITKWKYPGFSKLNKDCKYGISRMQISRAVAENKIIKSAIFLSNNTDSAFLDFDNVVNIKNRFPRINAEKVIALISESE